MCLTGAYKMVKIGNKSNILLYQNFTYSLRMQTKNYGTYCCTKINSDNCMARIRLNACGDIIDEETEHNHLSDSLKQDEYELFMVSDLDTDSDSNSFIS